MQQLKLPSPGMWAVNIAGGPFLGRGRSWGNGSDGGAEYKAYFELKSLIWIRADALYLGLCNEVCF